MILSIKLLDGQDLEFVVPKDSCVIGRSSQSDVVIPHEGMSRKHCMIEVKNGEFYVTDLQSINGVFIDGEKISPGEPIRFAPYLNLSFGVVNSLHIELEENKALRASAQPAASSFNDTKTNTKQILKKKPAQALNAKAPTAPVKESNKKRLFLMLIILSAVAGVVLSVMNSQTDEHPLSAEEQYE